MLICPFFFFNDTATTEIYTLSLHDALPILEHRARHGEKRLERYLHPEPADRDVDDHERHPPEERSEEHTSELQSQSNLVCRLLLEKKKTSRNSATASSLTIAAPIDTQPGLV